LSRPFHALFTDVRAHGTRMVVAQHFSTAAATSAAHHDETRKSVPSTSIGTCWLRALEADKHETERLVYDPFARRLCGEAAAGPGTTWIHSSDLPMEFWIDMMAVRTRWGDDAIALAGTKQLVILGAGLDSRAWRLVALKDLPVFEIDFPEVQDAKKNLLSGVDPLANLHSVSTNLAVDDWGKALLASGFHPELPSTWLLEGLTGYLTTGELRTLFQQIGTLSSSTSSLIATFTGAGSGHTTDMHRTIYKDKKEVEDLMAEQGWHGPALDFQDLAAKHGRSRHIPSSWKYFCFVGTR